MRAHRPHRTVGWGLGIPLSLGVGKGDYLGRMGIPLAAVQWYFPYLIIDISVL